MRREKNRPRLRGRRRNRGIRRPGYPESLRHVRRQTEELCILALKKDPRLLYLVRERTLEIARVAVEGYSGNWHFIDEKFRDILRLENELESA